MGRRGGGAGTAPTVKAPSGGFGGKSSFDRLAAELGVDAKQQSERKW